MRHKCTTLKNEKWTFNKSLSQFNYFTYYSNLMRSTNITAATSAGKYNWISNITVIKYKWKKNAVNQNVGFLLSYMQLNCSRKRVSKMLLEFFTVIFFFYYTKFKTQISHWIYNQSNITIGILNLACFWKQV